MSSSTSSSRNGRRRKNASTFSKDLREWMSNAASFLGKTSLPRLPHSGPRCFAQWATPEERQHFLEGLAGVDEQCGELFGKDFVAASPAQRTTLLRAMDD